MKHNYTLITGATSGIGLALAQEAAADHRPLVLVARRADRLAEVQQQLTEHYGIVVKTFAIDLSLMEHCDALFAFTQQENIAVDILINNAGFGDHQTFADCELERQMEMIQLNISALTRLTRLFLPAMIARQAGRILNVASVAAFCGGPYLSVYYATKAYVLSFSEALHLELKGTGVAVTTLCPGPTATDFGVNAQLKGSHIFSFARPSTALQVAREGYRRMLLGKIHAYPGWITPLAALSVRFVPRKWAAWIAGKINARP